MSHEVSEFDKFEQLSDADRQNIQRTLNAFCEAVERAGLCSVEQLAELLNDGLADEMESDRYSDDSVSETVHRTLEHFFEAVRNESH